MQHCPMGLALVMVLACASEGAALASSGGGPQPVRLARASEITHEFCLPPCLCPSGPETGPLAGGLVLVPEVLQPPVYARYRVEQVHWTGMTSRGGDTLVGGGTYEEFGDFVLQRRLQLELSPNGLDLQRFDTGLVVDPQPLAAMGPQFGCQQISILVVWVPRCEADYNADGTVDPDDLSDYITGFFASPADARSDFDLDGDVNPDDLSDFITTFFAACSL